ncbi:MAG: hypothetical protein LC795_17590 [Acidobacteria bacterium]|nr:hypothetical protein [Acidobacteriota bacterium]
MPQTNKPSSALSAAKWLASAIGQYYVGNFWPKLGGTLVAGAVSYFQAVFAHDGGVPWWIAIMYAVITFAVLTALWLLIFSRRKPQTQQAIAAAPLPQTTSTANNEFNPQNEVSQKVEANPHVEANPRVEASPRVEANPRNELNQTFVFHATPQSQNPPQEQPRTQQQEFKPPRLDAVDATFERVYVNPAGELQDKSDLAYPEADLALVPVAFAEFQRGVDDSSEPWVDVRAKINFLDADGNHLFRVRDAHWRKAIGEYANFETGDWDEIIVAIVGDGVALPYAGEYETVDRVGFDDIRSFKGKGRKIEADRLRIRIELIGRRGSNITLNQTFDYELIVAPKPAFRLRERVEIQRARALEELLPLLREGHELERVGYVMLDRTRSNYSHYLTWCEQVERAIKLYLDEIFITRFHAQDDETNKNWVTEMHGRIVELEKIVKELRG